MCPKRFNVELPGLYLKTWWSWIWHLMISDCGRDSLYGHPTKSTRIYRSRHHTVQEICRICLYRLHLAQLLGEWSGVENTMHVDVIWCCSWYYHFYDVSVAILVDASFYHLGRYWICQQMAAMGWVESQTELSAWHLPPIMLVLWKSPCGNRKFPKTLMYTWKRCDRIEVCNHKFWVR